MKNIEAQYSRYIRVRLSDRQFNKLTRLSKGAKLTKSEYIRQLINGVLPQERPPVDFYKVLTEIRRISNAAEVLTLNSYNNKNLEAHQIEKVAKDLRPIANMLFEYVTLPIKIENTNNIQELKKYIEVTGYGCNKDMED